MPETVIQLQQVDFYRGKRAIFNSLEIAIPKGKVSAILGPSGTGKTTLLHLIGGLLKADRGEVCVFDKNIATLSYDSLFALRSKMGMLFQSGALFTSMSVYDNVAFPLRELTQLPESVIYDIVLMKLEAVGLRGARNLMPNELSGGMARRVALARAIALDPAVMLYDEPFTGLDPISMGVVVKLIRTLNDALQLTSVIVTHDVQEVLSIADHIFILSEGRVIADGTPDEIRHNTSPMVKQFIGGEPDGPVPFSFPSDSFEQDLFSKEPH